MISRILFLFVKGHHKLPNLCFRCLSICQGHDKGYIYYGLQNGNQCWCGKEIPDAKFHKNNAECDKPCPGESNTKCGGHNRMNVYQIRSDQSRPDPKGGCYEDNTNGKRLFDVDTKTFQSPTISDDMSQTR